MAICISHLFAGMRGSIAGVTYFTTGAGQIIARMKTHPVNPQTGLQTAVRSNFANAVTEWEALSSSDRSLWNDYADSLGTGQSGRSVFISNYALALWYQDIDPAEITPTTDPPLDPGVLPIVDPAPAVYSGIGTGIAVKVTNPNLYDILVSAQRSRQYSVARNTLQGPFDASTNEVDTVAAAGQADIIFEGLVEGGIYFVRLKAIRPELYHTVSASYIVRCVAVTNVP